MAYATVDELIANYLPQVPDTETNAARLAQFLDIATEVVDGYLGFAFAGYASTATAKTFYGGGTQWLRVPAHQVSTLSAISVLGQTITDYEVESDNHFYLYREATWPVGRYTGTAKWGYGSAPERVVDVACQIAVNLWRGADRGMWSDFVGGEDGGGMAYARALTNYQRMALDQVRNGLSEGFA